MRSFRDICDLIYGIILTVFFFYETYYIEEISPHFLTPILLLLLGFYTFFLLFLYYRCLNPNTVLIKEEIILDNNGVTFIETLNKGLTKFKNKQHANWVDIQGIHIASHSTNCFWMIAVKNSSSLIISTEALGSDELLKHLQQHFSSFDNLAYTYAMVSLEDNIFQCWKA
ncbi:MAG: hypothetical protein EPO11_04585 [Gammaproteobacteria bacterium]|nr:MAG: hypothetical protein EPO11_04585 [Gammaproteobacteria bacterium]